MKDIPCKHVKGGCTDSRPGVFQGKPITRRRYVCSRCNQRFTTYEIRQEQFETFQGLEKLAELLKEAVKCLE